MTTSEKVAYLKGLAEGMGVQNDAGQGKLIHVIIDVLEDLALDLADTKDALVELTVTETDPGFAGNTATNVTKPATLETGAEIKVPLFINPGDRIKIDTRSGEYLERAKG